ncbi:MAG: hypothetical protein JNL74_22360, partial [Fibrobacteres bacterium]|nr:hypothetical protein [Fibrobacterota bacterium]
RIDIEGLSGGRKVKITSEPAVNGQKPIVLEGINLNLGVLHISTPDGHITASAPGLMQPKETAEFEITGKNGQRTFTVEGPSKFILLKGEIRPRNGKFTFPMLIHGNGEYPFDINLDLTVKPGQNFKYYYYQNAVTPWIDKAFKNKKVTKIGKKISDFFQYPLTELEVDKQSVLNITGSPTKGTVRLKGRVTSYKGYVHYAGNDFKNDIEVELDFDGSADPRPIISASAKTIIRPENQNEVPREISIRLYVKDPRTGVELAKGRFNDIRLVPSATDPFLDPEGGEGTTFQQLIGSNSNKGDIQGNIGRFAMSEGRAMFEKMFMQRLFTQYVERTVLGFGREYINPILGINVTPDVFRIEIESNNTINYIDMPIWNWQDFRRDLLEKTEFITGKYFFNGSLFLNYSSQLDLAATPDKLEIEKLHHRLGLEVTPWRYLYFNMDYDISEISDAATGRFDPTAFRSNLRLRLPIKKIQQIFEKEERTVP